MSLLSYMLVLVFTSKIWLGLGQISDSSNLGNPVRDVLLRKKPAFVLDLVQITPPQFGQLVQLFFKR